jgi:hypothetical protein
MADVNMLIAKIVKLHSVRMEGETFDLDDRAAFNHERASINHIIQQTKVGSSGISRRFCTRQTKCRRRISGC